MEKDITELFCIVDDFCHLYNEYCSRKLISNREIKSYENGLYIETIFNCLKNKMDLVHTRYRSPVNALTSPSTRPLHVSILSQP